MKSIESLSEFFKVDRFYLLKAVVKKALRADGSFELVYGFVRGDDEIEETKLLNTINRVDSSFISLEDAESSEIAQAGKNGVLEVGFIGPYGLGYITQSSHIYFDESLREAKGLICGANEKDYHFVGVDLDTFENLNFADLAQTQEGDLCPKCNGELYYTKGIEVGHIFKLGTKYSHAMNAQFLDKDGKAQDLIMGCYGFGVSRILPAILEQKSDELGCVWGKEVKVFDLAIIISNVKDIAQSEFATKIYEECKARGIDVLLDDRDERFGVKMKDFELLGFSFALIVGKGLNEGRLELIKREGLKKFELQCDENILENLLGILGRNS